jgi:hypothetical protein
MQLFLDTADIDTLRELADTGLGGRRHHQSLPDRQSPDASSSSRPWPSRRADPWAPSGRGLLRGVRDHDAGRSQARRLAPNVVVKLPLTFDGLAPRARVSSRGSAPTSPVLLRHPGALGRHGGATSSPPSWPPGRLRAEAATDREIRAVYDLVRVRHRDPRARSASRPTYAPPALGRRLLHPAAGGVQGARQAPLNTSAQTVPLKTGPARASPSCEPTGGRARAS